MADARPRPPVPQIVVVAGLIAGAVDIVAAAAINGVAPAVIFRAIASGLIGAQAYAKGSGPVWLGAVLQVVMSWIIAAIYVSAAARMHVLTRRPLLFGILYGFGIFIVMNLVVAPLSAVTPKPHITIMWLVLNIAAMLLFGLIVSMLTARSAATVQTH